VGRGGGRSGDGVAEAAVTAAAGEERVGTVPGEEMAAWSARYQRSSAELAPRADDERLDARLIGAASDPEVAVLAPAGAPRVGAQLTHTANEKKVKAARTRLPSVRFRS